MPSDQRHVREQSGTQLSFDFDERMLGACAPRDDVAPIDVREMRETLGLSQHALARMSGIDRSTVHRIERGSQSPSRETLQRLSRILENEDTEALELARLGIAAGTREHLREVVAWVLDPVARYVVAMHPHGLEVEQVAEVLGVSASFVQVTQSRALAKFAALKIAESPEGELVRELVAMLRGEG